MTGQPDGTFGRRLTWLGEKYETVWQRVSEGWKCLQESTSRLKDEIETNKMRNKSCSVSLNDCREMKRQLNSKEEIGTERVAR
jgi:hypothetical protein